MEVVSSEQQPPLPYQPVTGKPWRLTMGLRPLPRHAWLEVDQHRERELTAKGDLLATTPDVVIGVAPGSDAAQRELETAIIDDLAEHHGLEVHSVARADEAPIVRAARLVQEDLCLFERRGGTWEMTAACVCFPSRWTLSEKVGQNLSAIHGPVPGYAEALGRPVEALFNRLHPDRPVWRLNWTILDTNELHLPTPAARQGLHLPDDLSTMTFRIERQTLRTLPETGAICFTIRTYTAPLGELLADQPALAADLAATLRTVDVEMATYKGWADLLPSLIAWLESPSG